MDIELRHLRYFIVVAKESMSRAQGNGLACAAAAGGNRFRYCNTKWLAVSQLGQSGTAHSEQLSSALPPKPGITADIV